MANKQLIDIAGEITAETKHAYRFYNGARPVWLLKSQCEWDPNNKTMTMEEWLAKS